MLPDFEKKKQSLNKTKNKKKNKIKQRAYDCEYNLFRTWLVPP